MGPILQAPSSGAAALQSGAQHPQTRQHAPPAAQRTERDTRSYDTTLDDSDTLSENLSPCHARTTQAPQTRPSTGASMHKRADSVPAAHSSAAHVPTRPGTATSVHSRTASAAAGQPNPPTDAHYAAAPSDPASLIYNNVFNFSEQLQQQNEQRAPVGPVRKLASAAPASQQSVPQQTTRQAALQQLRSSRLQHAGGGEQAASGSAAAATAQAEGVARGLTRRTERSASVSTQARRKVRLFLGACVRWGTHE